MNTRNGSATTAPCDGESGPQATGRVGSHRVARGDSLTAGSGDAGPSDTAVPPGQNDPRVVAALEEYLAALREGRPASRDEFLSQHAEIADALRECLSVLEFIETAAGDSAGSSGLAAPLPADTVAPRAQLGDYRILREVGRGGMGVVYEAQQVSLDRRVALKILPFAAAIDPKQRQRFQIEAQAAAQLQHPHIVPIFAVGCDRGIHYYAMQFVAGRSLAAIIHEWGRDSGARAGDGSSSRTATWVSTEELPGSSTECRDSVPAGVAAGGSGSDDLGDDAAARGDSDERLWSAAVGSARESEPVDPIHQAREFCRNVARLGVDAADALDHAHGLGILHRDIKPANLLIDRHGAVWITDFGLARFPNEFSLTGTGDLIGTLRYMSPEQALARRGVVDQRTDIYSLGVTLYESLTLRPAFDGRDHHELLRQIAMDEPVAPRRLNSAVPRDLETIVLKAMAKDLCHRYATAQEFADDLRRFLADEPILARRPGVVERALRWTRRHRELVATAAAVVMISLTISTMLIWAQARQTEIQAAKTRAEAQKKEEVRNAYHAYMIESYPLIDQFAMQSIGQALGLAQGQAGPADRAEAPRMLSQWLKILQQINELPRTDRASRVVIARACTRLGYARTLLSMTRRTADGRPEPRLLALADADFRRSIALFDDLLTGSPGDANLRRYLADALGLFGMGCCHRFADRDTEAESSYRRSIELRRDLIRGTGFRNGNHADRIDVAGEVDNFGRLLGTVQVLATMLENTNRQAEAESLILQFQSDIGALATRLSGPESQALRRTLSELLLGQVSVATSEGRRTTIRNSKWALILDAGDAKACNNLAWALTSVPDDPWFDPKHALDLAEKAVKLNPLHWYFWNTRGVAAYRTADWDKAAESLQHSIQLNGGAGIDCFFLAMTCWQQGKRDEARQWFDRAIGWMNRTGSNDPELQRFHVEAAALLGMPNSGPGGENPGVPTVKPTMDTADQISFGRSRSG